LRDNGDMRRFGGISGDLRGNGDMRFGGISGYMMDYGDMKRVGRISGDLSNGYITRSGEI